MGLDIYYFKARKQDGIHAVATENSVQVSDMRKNNALYGLLKRDGIITGHNTEIAQVFPQDLERIARVVAEVLEHPERAETLMPTTDGFQFGSTDYDAGYWDDVLLAGKESVDLLESTDWDNENAYVCCWW